MYQRSIRYDGLTAALSCNFCRCSLLNIPVHYNRVLASQLVVSMILESTGPNFIQKAFYYF